MNSPNLKSSVALRGKAGGFTQVEVIVTAAILAVLVPLVFLSAKKVFLSSSLAVSANNLRVLAAGGQAYLGENNYRFWSWRKTSTDPENSGVQWWFGLEPLDSPRIEGSRILKPQKGPLGEYIPAGLCPDPSFRFTGKPFKPKFRFGYIGVGYNVLVGGGWGGVETPLSYFDFEKPEKTVIFATSAQINTFQRPASYKNPMLEELYGFDQNERSIHFRHHGKAMVVYATGNAGFLEMDESTRDSRAPEANVGRFAPKGSLLYLR